MKDVNDFFEQQKNFLITYFGHLKEATAKADRMTSKHKGEYFILFQETNLFRISRILNVIFL